MNSTKDVVVELLNRGADYTIVDNDVSHVFTTNISINIMSVLNKFVNEIN